MKLEYQPPAHQILYKKHSKNEVNSDRKNRQYIDDERHTVYIFNHSFIDSILTLFGLLHRCNSSRKKKILRILYT